MPTVMAKLVWKLFGRLRSQTNISVLPSRDNSLVVQVVKNLPAKQETQVRSLGWEDPLKKGEREIFAGKLPIFIRYHVSTPGLGRSPGEGNGNPPQYSCLENPMDSGAWWATVHGVAKSRTGLRTSHTHSKLW